MDDSWRTRILTRRPDPGIFSSNVKSSSRRSFSDDSTVTPLHSIGVPFSWEKLPGKPKEFTYPRKNESANNLLPLPPHRKNHSSNTSRKKNMSRPDIGDPFTTALVECSKGATADGKRNRGEPRKFLRTSSIGLMSIYGSCRRGCAVSESIVYLPRSIDDHLLLSTRPGRH